MAAKLRRGLRKPPQESVRRAVAEARLEIQRVTAQRVAGRLTTERLLEATGARDLDALWATLARRPFPFVSNADGLEGHEEVVPGEPNRVRRGAEAAVARRVDVLGSGPVELGCPIQWHLDVKTGLSWPDGYGRRADVADLSRPSDMKVPWEISRLHWLLPAGQAYLLSGEETYAAVVRDVLDEWIAANPYAYTINWASPMEAAMRVVVWTWFFHVFAESAPWALPDFRSRFLRALYLHGRFLEENLERSDVNGNHYTADAVGLVFAGLFFGGPGRPPRWARTGWRILTAEIEKQVHPDGVDFEASTAYHRLVCELFLGAALFRRRIGLEVPAPYSDRLAAMARFAATYTRPDGTSPLWGDADDARVLPLGGNPLGDHRYLAGIVAGEWGRDDLAREVAGPRGEVMWVLGSSAAAELRAAPAIPDPESRAFFGGGCFVMRTRCDHVFVDCGPVGLAGRGGHGHNDCLSFEATLDGETLFVDSGSYVYTASPGERNAFRSTLAHNTPTVDGEEQNRIPPHDLWRLSDDARPSVRRWRANGSRDLFVGSHSGYLRLPGRPLPVRSVALDRTRHVLVVLDEFEGRLEHELRVPFHLAPGVDVVEERPGRVELVAGEKRFSFRWTDEGAWECRVVSAETSPSYGVKRSTRSLRLTRRGPLAALLVVVAPAALEGPSADELARLLSRTADLLGSWSQALTNRPT